MFFSLRSSTSSAPGDQTGPIVHRSSYRAPQPAVEADPAEHPAAFEQPTAPERSAFGPAVDRAIAAADAAASTGVDDETSRDDDEHASLRVPHAARRARHRAEPVGNRRAGARGIRRLAALSGASAILGISALGAVSAFGGDLASANAASAPAAKASGAPVATGAGDTLTVAPDDDPVVQGGLSVASAPFTGGTQITVQGEQLDQVAAVSVGGAPATIVAADESQLTFAVPAVADTTLGAVPVTMTDASGEAVEAEAPKSASLASLTSADPASILAAPTTIEVPQQLTLTYTSDPRIDAQVGYVLAYWNDYNSDAYSVISGNDCANFTSQSLIARGWAMDAGWYYDAATGQSSSSWTSSTAMRDWLSSRPDLATPLDDSQRGLVKVGDIAQFDWDGSGDRDHTAVVTRVEHSDSGTRIWVGGHTKDADYWDVDEALASGGGSVAYFSLK